MTNPTPVVIHSTAGLTPDGVSGYLKAIYAGVSAGLLALATALADGQVTGPEWVGIALAALVAGGGTYWLPNAVKPVAIVPIPETMLGVAGPPKPYLDDLGQPVNLTRPPPDSPSGISKSTDGSA